MADKKGKLSEYDAKREFRETPEPGPEVRSDRRGPLLFVVQKHAATRLHYDLRLELDGVLKSWALPKGISYDPKVKNLAVMVEDHPFDYGSFEGVIPPNQYGSGEVIVWDCGSYWCDENHDFPADTREEEEARIRAGLESGKLGFTTRGHKMKGSWALIRMKDEPNWLFFKHSGEFEHWKDDPLAEENSVLSELSILDLKRGERPGPRREAESLIPFGKPEAIPRKLLPMLCDLGPPAGGPKPPPLLHDARYAFEPKLDGIRALAFIERDQVKIITRRGLDQTSQFPELCRHLARQKTAGLVLDGEIVAFEDGKPGFQSMLKRFHLKDKAAIERADQEIPCVFYAFDILHYEGVETRSCPLSERRRFLEQALNPTERVQLVTQIVGDGETLYSAVLQTGMEGIVAKKLDSKYEAGKRSSCWLKIKNTLSAEFIVGGYSKGEGSRSASFGALLLGYRTDPKSEKLSYVGHVGSGFDEAKLRDLLNRLQPLEQMSSPFLSKPELHGPTKWVKPELVVEVKFNEITPGGVLRAPVFVRVREDVPPSEITGLGMESRLTTTTENAQDEPQDEPPAMPAKAREEPDAAPPPPKEATVGETSIEVRNVLDQLQGKEKNLSLAVGGHEVNLTNLDKELWPANEQAGLPPLTKREYLAYLARISPYLIPHTQDRPLTMIRWPNGIHGQKFFQKHYEHKLPAFAEVVRLYSESNSEDQEYLLLNNLPTLLWLGQMGTLEFHIWHSRCVTGPSLAGSAADGEDLTANFTGSAENIEGSLLNFPDYVCFDIDPYIYSGKEKKGEEPELNREAFEKGKTAAFLLKKLLDGVGMTSFVKTTGKTGLHIFAPIVRNLDFTTVRGICEAFCRSLERDHPRLITTEWSVPKRTGKIFMDYNMNVRGKTLGCAYCPRALPNQAVAMPITWEELETVYPDDFTMRNCFETLERRGDVWAGLLDAKVDLASLVGG
jgi:bifunctional non-homologous end joining protein LigD